MQQQLQEHLRNIEIRSCLHFINVVVLFPHQSYGLIKSLQ